MGLFKSKQQKEMEQRMLIRKTMQKIQKYIQNLENQKVKYIEWAKTAKQKGIDSQYNLAVSGLKTAVAQQKKAEEILLNFELTSQMRDLNVMTSEFLGGMSSLSREMAKISKNMDFVKVQQEFEVAMMGVEETTFNLDNMLDSSESSFKSIAADSSKVDDDEINRLINNEVTDEENSRDQEIEKKLAEIQKQIKG